MLGVRTTSSNRELAEASDLVIAAVKPWDVAQVMEEISPSFEATDKAVTSVAAGVSIATHLREPAARDGDPARDAERVRLGGTRLRRSHRQRGGPRRRCPRSWISSATSARCMELPERLFDAATALHGSGPAYVALFADALIQAGVREGIPRDVARRLVVGTIGGTAVLLKERSAHQVRDEVMTPGGTTAAAFVAMEKAGFVAAVYDGVEAATEQARGLGG